MAIPASASVVSSGLGAYPSVFYDRTAIDTLRSNLFLYPALELKQMPDKSGVAMQIFGYGAMAANTTPATEGTPGAGQTLTQNTRTISLSQFVDYVSFSDKVVLTGISDTVAEGAGELAYRGALSVDTVISTAVDAAATADPTAVISLTGTNYLTAAISRKAGMQLRSVNVKPKTNGLFFGVCPSLTAFDLINDATAGGFIDLTKYTDPKPLQEGIPGTNRIGVVGGVEWYESNALPFTAGSPNIYKSYCFGKDAFIASSLGKTQLGQKNFSVKVSKFDQPIAVDPANQIAAAAAYNFYFGLTKRPGAVSGFRQVTSPSSIG
jgi:N4-gp56 family major capsid protein